MIASITYFNPTSTSGPDGYINYKMSGGGPGCGILGWILIILIVLEVIGKM